MKNFEELEQFINSHINNWKELLKKDPYNLQSITQCSYNNNWYVLVYNLYDSDLMNPVVRQIANQELSGNDRIHIIEPLEVVDFHNFMKASYLILTDSGGIQEEAPALGKPVLVMRDTTERPEGIEAGTLKLVGTSEDNIFNEFNRLLSDSSEYNKMSKANNPYGDGRASERIANILEFGKMH